MLKIVQLPQTPSKHLTHATPPQHALAQGKDRPSDASSVLDIKKINRPASEQEVKLLLDKSVEEATLLKICRQVSSRGPQRFLRSISFHPPLTLPTLFFVLSSRRSNSAPSP